MDLPFSQLTENTKKACSCSAISIFFIILFILTPLSEFILTSMIVKLIIICLLTYTIYLNYQQGKYMKILSQNSQSNEAQSQINMNIICNYVFSFFIGLIILFVLRTFF
jgi:hypothetical protein